MTQVLQSMEARQPSELTRESNFYDSDGDKAKGPTMSYGPYDDSGSYVSSDEYTDESYTQSDSEYSQNDYNDELSRSSAGNERSGFLPDIHNMKNKYHTYPEIEVASHNTVTLYRNGDRHFPGISFVVGPQIKSWSYLLDQMTARTKPPWGAVRKVFHLDTGKRISAIDDLEHGEAYVVARMEAFKRVNYYDIQDVNTKNRLYEKPKPKMKPKKVEGRNVIEMPITIYVLAQDDRKGIVTKLVLKSRDRTSFQHVLDLVTERLGFEKLQTSAKKLVDLETKQSITALEGVRHGRFYVAVNKPQNKRLPQFRVNSARELVPLPKKKTRFQDMPIMFDGPIRGKIDVGEKLVEAREARGIVSDVGRVRRLHRAPSELKPVKQPFRSMVSIAEPPASIQYQRLKVMKTPEDRANWKLVHNLIDDESMTLIEEVLQEYQQSIYQLLNNFVIMRSSNKEEYTPQSPSPPPAAINTRRRRRASSLAPSYEYDKYISAFMGFINQPDVDIFGDSEDLTESQSLLKEHFIRAMEAAVDGRLSHWEEDPITLVTLIILLDQIPRRVFSGTADQYAGDENSFETIKRAIEETAIIQKVASQHLLYICIALSHQESMYAQELQQQIWKDMEKTAFPKEDYDHVSRQFDKNRSTIERFGRFPERNEVLERRSTPEEEAWLAEQRAAVRQREREKNEQSQEVFQEETRSSPKRSFWGRRSTKRATAITKTR